MPYSHICKHECPDKCWPDKHCDTHGGCTCSAKPGAMKQQEEGEEDKEEPEEVLGSGDRSCECINSTHPSYQEAAPLMESKGLPEDYGV